jgi:hypothetical protein
VGTDGHHTGWRHADRYRAHRREGRCLCWQVQRHARYLLHREPDQGRVRQEGKKTDIAAIEYLLADLDPDEGESSEAAKARYLEQLEAFEPKPTVIVDSGNGIQCAWKLQNRIGLGEPIKTTDDEGEEVLEFSSEDQAIIDDVEARSAALMLRLGGKPGTQNIDRILRLPGTTNLPNQKKRDAGRVACPTKLIAFNGANYSLDAFPPPDAGNTNKQSSQKQGKSGINIDTLPLSDRIKNLIRGIDDPEHLYPSRSEAVMAVLVAMAGAGCTNEDMSAVMLDQTLPIGKHVRERSDKAAYLAKQIAKARKLAIDPDVAKLNERYALVLVGDKVAIMNTAATTGIQLMTLGAFEQWHRNRFIVRDGKRRPLAKHWLAHPQRRQYEGLTFSPGRSLPGHYNLWCGFAVEPKPGECTKFLDHLKDNVCRGDDNLYQWVVGWLADIFQHPNRKMGTALAIRGKQGTGKTKVGQVIGSLLGRHYVLVPEPRYVTGRFNSHLVSCLLLHADEGFWAGDRTAEGKLKDLITGLDHFIEYKGKEPIRVQNFIRLLVTGNPDWVVPVSLEERRFAVLDIGEHRMRDTEYFAAIDAEMDSGGREALLDHLLRVDLSKVDLRLIPKTAALLDQKVASLNSEQAWWLDTLTRGELPWGCDGRWQCPTEKLFDRYISHASKTGIRRRAIETQIGIFLTKHVPELNKKRGSYKVFTATGKTIGASGLVYEFPSLTNCRDAFAKLLQQEIKWDDTDWKHEPPPDAGDGKLL